MGSHSWGRQLKPLLSGRVGPHLLEVNQILCTHVIIPRQHVESRRSLYDQIAEDVRALQPQVPLIIGGCVVPWGRTFLLRHIRDTTVGQHELLIPEVMQEIQPFSDLACRIKGSIDIRTSQNPP